MNRIMIFKANEDPHSYQCQQEVLEADIILVEAAHNENYFYVLKHRDRVSHTYIYKTHVADFLLGKSVRVYNRSETALNDIDEWREAGNEFEQQMDEMLVQMKKERRPLNALSRMDLDD